MDLLRKCFPYSFGVETLKDLIVTIIAYILTGLLIGLLLDSCPIFPLLALFFSC